MQRFRAAILMTALLLATAVPALASFHLMQIEQITGDVFGDPGAQAIQLRMRSLGQNFVQNGKVMVYDANGLNPIEIVNMGAAVANGASGDRVLIASSSFQLECGFAPDFPMTNLIPPSYFAAGSLTFENNLGTQTLWRFSWGGAAYAGSNLGSILNDADGDYGPPFTGPLPVGTGDALAFTGAATALSTTNVGDYTTASPATWTTNAGNVCTIMAPPPVAVPDVPTVNGARITLSRPSPNPFRAGTSVVLDLPGRVRTTVDVYDVLGHRVRNLVSGEVLPNGQHRIDWDGRDSAGDLVADGVYFFRVNAGIETRTVKGVRIR